MSLEPIVDDGDVGGGLVVDGEFVVSGGEAPVVFELVDTAFDGVPVLVDGRVERGWPPALAAPAPAVCGLVGRGGDGGLDVMGAQPVAVRAGRVGAVGQYSVRTPSWGPAGLGTRIFSRTVISSGLSLACPGVW